MSLTYTILLVLFLLVAIFLVVLILVQQGKGAGMGASFGAGASNTLFGSAGSTNFLTKSTWVLTVIFFCLSVILGYLNTHKNKKPVGFTQIEEPAEATNTKAEVDVKDPKPVVVKAEEKKADEAAPVKAVEPKADEATKTETEVVEPAKTEETAPAKEEAAK